MKNLNRKKKIISVTVSINYRVCCSSTTLRVGLLLVIEVLSYELDRAHHRLQYILFAKR